MQEFCNAYMLLLLKVVNGGKAISNIIYIIKKT